MTTRDKPASLLSTVFEEPQFKASRLPPNNPPTSAESAAKAEAPHAAPKTVPARAKKVAPPRAMAAPAREIELKLEGSSEALKKLKRAPGLRALSKVRASSKTLTSTYFDTPDFDLREGGVALRVRKSGRSLVQTLKADMKAKGVAADRLEIETPVGDPEPDLDAVPEELKRKISALTGGEPIKPLFTTDFRRTVRPLMTPEGSEIELALDEGSVFAGEAEAPIAEVELELKSGDAASLFKVAKMLSEMAPLRVRMGSKADLGYALAGRAAPGAVKAGKLDLDAEATAAAAYEAILRHCIQHLIANEPAVMSQGLVEGVHQMRVALRRLRSAFTVFHAACATPDGDALAEKAKFYGEVLGAARDLDVFVTQTLPPLIAEFDEEQGLSLLLERAETERNAAWKTVRETLNEPAFTHFVLDLALYTESGDWRDAGAEALSVPGRDFAVASLDKRLKKARKLGRRLEDLDKEARHDLRKRLKKLRYTADFFAGFFGRKKAAKALSHLSSLQDVFGDLNDAATAHLMVDRLTGPDSLPKKEAAALGRAGGLLLGWQEHRAHMTWEGAVGLWKAFDKKPAFWR